MKLSVEQAALKRSITKARQSILALEKKICKLRKECRHVFPPYEPFGLAICLVCDESFGWSCSKSPDGVCHYDNRGGFVNLIDGTKVPVPPGHEEAFENDDQCIWCGLPSERK